MRKVILLLTVLAVTASAALGQGRTVKGVVTSAEDGLPLPQLSVLIKGTTTGVVTDMNGVYTINVAGPDAVLLFKYTGFDTQEIAVGDKTEINVVMKPALEEIEDVVVVAYGTVKRESMVGAQSSVGSKQLERRPVTNISNALAASAPGVQVITSTGQPGSSADIRIRGFGSVNASSAPLYVVDGAIYNGAISDIAPSDIQSVSVLKDAASTALYGSSAGNGVILITTKSGSKRSGGNFVFTTNQGFSMRGMKDYERVTAEEILPLRWQQKYNDNFYTRGYDQETAALNASFFLIYKLGKAWNPFNGDLGYISTQNAKSFKLADKPLAGWNNVPYVVTKDGELNPKVTGLKWGDDLDWEKALFRLGYRHEYTLSGGYTADKFRSFMSIGYIDEQGYKIKTGYKRYSARLNASYDVNKWFTTGVSLSYTRTHSEAPKTASGNYSSNSFSFARNVAPIFPIHEHNADGSYVLKEGEKVYDHSSFRPYSGGFNAVEESYLDLAVTERDAVMSRVFGEVRLLPELTFKSNLSYDLYKPSSKKRYNNVMGDQPQGMLIMDMAREHTLTFNQLLEYNQTFDEVHQISALIGHENYEYYTQDFEAIRENMLVLGVDEFSNLATMNAIESSSATYRKEGFFARVNYDYSNRYNLSASYRLDGSSRFASNKRWGNFWSVGAGWRIINESFMEPTRSWLSDLKLRLSVGQTGNDAVSGFYPYMRLLGYGAKNYNVIGLVDNQLGNPDLVWEAQTSYDVALDFGLFHRVNATVEFFVKESSDLLFSYRLPLSTGFSKQDRNIGKVRNYGIEFNVNATVLKIEDFRWDVNVNGTWYRNTLVQLPEENREKGIEVKTKKYLEGHSIMDFYLEEFIGVDPKDGIAIYRLDTAKYGTEEAINDTDSITMTKIGEFAQKHYCGSSIPDLYGGFGTTFSWRGLELGLQFAYQIGGKVYDGAYAGLMSRDLEFAHSAHVDLKKAWRKPGDVTDVPRLDAGFWGTYSTWQSDRFLIDASSLMLRNVSLTYTLPDKWIKPLRVISKVRVGVMGENLFLLSRRQGLNPMNSYAGVSGTAFYEFARTFTGTVSITF